MLISLAKEEMQAGFDLRWFGQAQVEMKQKLAYRREKIQDEVL